MLVNTDWPWWLHSVAVKICSKLKHEAYFVYSMDSTQQRLAFVTVCYVDLF